MLRNVTLFIASLLLTGCAGMSQNAGFVLEGKSSQGTEAPWHGRAIEGKFVTLSCVEAIPFVFSRHPDWKSEIRDESRMYESSGEMVPVERLVQRAVIYTQLGVRYLSAVRRMPPRGGYYVIMPCGMVKTLLIGGEDVFLVSNDETRLLTLDGRVVWLVKNQKPSALTADFREHVVRSKLRHFTTFRRDESDGLAELKALEEMFPLRAEVDGTVYAVTADFPKVATLTSGENGLDCFITKGALFLGSDPLSMLIPNTINLPRNVKAAQGDCHRVEKAERKE